MEIDYRIAYNLTFSSLCPLKRPRNFVSIYAMIFRAFLQPTYANIHRYEVNDNFTQHSNI